MNNILLITVCIIPILILLWYVYIKDKVEKEPVYLLFLLFIGGIIACVISILLDAVLKNFIQFLNWQYSDMNIIQIIFKTLITIAVIEEGSKWIVNYITIWRNKNFNHIYDPIVYCVFVSLGFALFENIIYTITFKNYGIMPIVMRGLISVPCHAVFGVFMGFYLGISKNAIAYNKIKQSEKYKLLSIATPIIFHFIYNLCLVKQNRIVYCVFIIYLITMYISAYNKIKKLSNIHKMLKENDTSK